MLALPVNEDGPQASGAMPGHAPAPRLLDRIAALDVSVKFFGVELSLGAKTRPEREPGRE